MPSRKPLPPLPLSIGLHIGAHKTASSHLQNVLYRNREMLAGEEIRVYGPGYLRMKGRDLAAMFGLSWSESPPPRRNADAQLRFLAKGRKRLVFTEENFAGNLVDNKGLANLPLYPFGPERVEELVAKWAPVETQLYVAIRNPASFLASAYSQSLFGGADASPRMFRANNEWRMIDWADYITRLRAVTGVSDLYVWRQEDYALSHRLILRRLLRWKVGGRVETVPDLINQRMSTAAVLQTLAWIKEGKSGALARDARKAFPVSDTNPPFQLYAPSTLAAAQAIYDQQFAQIQAMDGVTVLHPPPAMRAAQTQG